MTHKVLIVEDDIDDQMFFVEAISAIDPFIMISVVNNGLEALEHLRNTNTYPSLIIVDLNMPLMSGYEFLSKVKKIREFMFIPIAVFTTSSAVDQDGIFRLGAARFFVKPTTQAGFKTSLKTILP